MTKPIATTPYTSHNDNRAVLRSRTSWSHSPIVMAMITNNRMTNCQDVSAMVQECNDSGSQAQVCFTASRYLEFCMNKGGSS